MFQEGLSQKGGKNNGGYNFFQNSKETMHKCVRVFKIN